MSAPLPPLHALAIVHPTTRIREPRRTRGSAPFAALARLWTWLMAPLDQGQPSMRAQLLARARACAASAAAQR